MILRALTTVNSQVNITSIFTHFRFRLASATRDTSRRIKSYNMPWWLRGIAKQVEMIDKHNCLLVERIITGKIVNIVSIVCISHSTFDIVPDWSFTLI